MLDLSLYILLGLAVIVIAVWGGIVAVKALPLEQKHSVHLWVFIGCGIAAFILTVAVGFRNYYAQKDADKQKTELTKSLSNTSGELEKANNKLDQSRLFEEYMKGQLSGLSMMVGKLDSDGNPASTALAKALAGIAGSRNASGVEPPAIQRMNNQQLRSKVIDFSNALRKEASDYQTQEESEPVGTRTQFHNPPTKEENEEMDKDFQARMNRTLANANNFKLRIQQNYEVDATVYKDELLRRLGPQTPWERASITFWGYSGNSGPIFVTTFTVSGTADYLEHLAKQLPQ